MGIRAGAIAGALVSIFVAPGAWAQSPADPDAPAAPPVTANAPPPSPAGAESLTDGLPAEAPPAELLPPDAPPPMRKRSHGVVVESTLGVMGFAGQFRHVAPPAYWWRTQLGYELTSWLMVYGAGEIAFTDTGESQDESHTVAFPILGFSGGLRATVHPSERVAFYVEGEAGAVTANIAHDTLKVLGFQNAESLNAAFGGRVGLEWYQMDRHLALQASGGVEYASGFAKTIGPSDLPLFWTSGVGLRYTF